jgi:hypothetical protein
MGKVVVIASLIATAETAGRIAGEITSEVRSIWWVLMQIQGEFLYDF